MSLVLDALKSLEDRRQRTFPLSRNTPAPEPPIDTAPAALQHEIEADVDPPTIAIAPFDDTPVVHFDEAPLPSVCLLPMTSEVCDAYRALALRVDEDLARDARILLFLTPDQSTRKTFSMVQLAQAFARQSTGTVLLVDGDPQRGRLSKCAGINGEGLIEVRQGAAEWCDVIRRTTDPRVDFAPAGHAPLAVPARPGFGLESLGEDYRWVVVGLADASQLETAWVAAAADAVYFVVSRSRTQPQATSEALRALRAAGANVRGCVLVDD